LKLFDGDQLKDLIEGAFEGEDENGLQAEKVAILDAL